MKQFQLGNNQINTNAKILLNELHLKSVGTELNEPYEKSEIHQEAFNGALGTDGGGVVGVNDSKEEPHRYSGFS